MPGVWARKKTGADDGVKRRGAHAYQLLLDGAECEDASDNENDVELLFAGSRQPHNSAPIRLRIYRCLMF